VPASPVRRAIEVGSIVYLRRPTASDRAEFVQLRRTNRRHLEQWEPIPRGVNAFTPIELNKAFDRELKLRRTRTDERFLICLVQTGEIAGKISISGIHRGPLQECRLGYWIGRQFARRGCTTEAVALACRHAFQTLGLHRVEANMQPRNHASRAVVRSNGFSQEGYSPRYLFIRSRWVDHERWAINLEDWMTSRARPNRPKPKPGERPQPPKPLNR
jgi:ribosomal-protein-alanine N-acetyltransferase